MEIITDTLSEAHEATIDVIVAQHAEIDIQTHVDKKEFTLEFEAEDGGDAIITLHILHPQREPQVSSGINYQQGFTNAYKKQFLTLTPHRADGNHATYTYWNRLKDQPIQKMLTILNGSGSMDIRNFEMKFVGDGDGRGFDQIDPLVKKLAEDPNSRRGVMVTWNPIIDTFSLEPPCMDMLQAKIRNGKLHLRVVFRSQDMLMGLPENLVGCCALQEYLVADINKIRPGLCNMGELTLVSLIPHIYKKRDGEDLDRMLNTIKKKKVAKMWHPIIR